MTLTKIETPNAPKALGHYEQGIIANGIITTAMQLPIRPDGSDAPLVDIRDQARQVLENVIAIIEAGGGSRETIIQMRVYLTDIGDWEVVNEIYEDILGKAKPARSVIMIAGLHKGFKIAVEGVATI